MKNIISIMFLFCFFLSVVFHVGIANSADCVNINTAPKEELEKIIHIGPSRVEQIINLRQEAPFVSLDDLQRVRGIGPARVADIKNQGLACVGGPQLEQEPATKETFQLKESPSAVASDPRSLQTMAAVGEQLPRLSNSRLVVSAALILAVFSGTIILVLKTKLNRV